MDSNLNQFLNNYTMQKKIFRISTVPGSLSGLLVGQLKMLNQYYDISAVSSPGPEMDIIKEREGVRVIEVPMERRISILKDFISLVKMVILFIKERPQMVHSMTPKAGLISMLAGWITGVPIRMHTFTGLVFPTAKGNMKKLLILMDKITCFCATHVNPEGEGVRRDLIKFHITNKPLHVLANGNVNGVDLDYFSRTEDVLKQAESIRKEGMFTFCFIGRIVKDKGINELISAFVRLYSENKNIRLLLVGSFEKDLDPVLPETEDAINNHEAIDFVGFQKDVRPYLMASDALVFPSYREGFPNVVLQAGAMGLPSIVTDINGCNEIIEDGVNGVIIQPKDADKLYDAMKVFVTNKDLVKSMAYVAREKIVAKYDRNIVWKALLEEYKRVIGE